MCAVPVPSLLDYEVTRAQTWPVAAIPVNVADPREIIFASGEAGVCVLFT